MTAAELKGAVLVDWGVLEYESALARQRELVAKRQAGEVPDTLVLVEHPHVITLGRRREAQGNVVAAGEVPVIEIERGGDVTYHGPGQLIGYPILQLDDEERDLHLFLRNMEQGIIDALGEYGLEAGREEGKTGVWMQGRKLASMGIACRKWVTFHGLGLNVNTDLSYFQRINPCGFNATVMSSVEKELGHPVDMEEMKGRLVAALSKTLNRDFRPAP